MQEFKNENTGEVLTKIFDENNETSERMRDSIDNLKREGFDLQSEHSNINRKSPCPCGSGKKFKNCHGE